ncbi:trypsin [Amycolatopsis antarctica]|uniref:Trypsin n=1 Tax=Amycolatopsis antarctica TaxID=1854586 RepID=A0A263D6X4_9PSEU|nr:trypsin-like serine protease [Amycolatopsis antarctica]OZM73327.1 trypsin [Amycolatopsis antarctica]
MKLSRVLPAVAGAVLAVTALGSTVASADTTSAPADVAPAIIDGGNAESGPWAARLFSGGQEACSATIIGPKWILTAQHCVEGGDLTFNIGDLDQSKGEKASAVNVTEHPSVDLALVELDREVDATYAKLADSQIVNNGDQVQVFGWGATCTDKPEIECQAQLLKVANVDVTGVNAPCTDYRGGDAVCASRGDGITAGGDSGGPMFSGDTQVGVASTSDRSSTTAYTHVASYRDWIKDTSGI